MLKKKPIFQQNISLNCKEKDMEICAVELVTKSSKFIILSLYRVPTGDINQYIKNLHDALTQLYKLQA
jgi:hypothetical protein